MECALTHMVRRWLREPDSVSSNLSSATNKLHDLGQPKFFDKKMGIIMLLI